MFYDTLKPLPTAHNARAIKLVSFLFVMVALHLFLIDSALSSLAANYPVTAGWKSAADFFNWIQAGQIKSMDPAFNLYFVSLILIIGAILFLHFSCDIVNQFLNWVFASRTKTFIALFLLFAAFLRYYLMPGPFTESGDGSAHLMQIWICRESFLKGEVPTWTNWLYCGSPFLQDYGPLFFYFAGLVACLTDHFDAAVKFSLFLIHLISGFTFFYAAAALTNDKRKALFGSMIYVLIGWHSHYLLVLGRYPAAPMYIFMPLAFKEAIFLAQANTRTPRQDSPAVFRLGLWFSLMFLCHFIYPLQFGLFLGVFIVSVLFVQYRGTGDKTALKMAALKFASAGLFILLLAGCYLIPFLLEKGGTMSGYHMEAENAMGQARRTFNLLSWFLWNNARFPLVSFDGKMWGDAYFGLSTFLVILLSLIFKAKYRKQFPLEPAFKGLLAALSAIFLVILFWNIWKFIPVVKMLYITECERYQLPLVFFLSMAALFAVQAMARIPAVKNAGRFLSIALPVLMVVVAVDMGSLTFQTPYGLKSDWDRHEDMSLYFEREYDAASCALPPVRAYYEGMSDYDFTLKGAPMCVRRARHPAFVGSYSQAAPLSYLYIRELYPLFRGNIETLPEINLNTRLLNFFYLTNTRLLILNGRKKVLQPGLTDSLRNFGEDKTLAWLKFGTPFIYSRSLKVFADSLLPKEYGLAVLDRYNIAYGEGYADAIWLNSGTPDSPASGPSAALKPQLKLINFSNTNKSVDLAFTSDSPLYLEMPYSWHPSLRVAINGQKVVPLRTALNFICIRTDAGENHIRLEGGLSGLRKTWIGLSLLLFVMMTGVLAFRRRKLAV